MPESVFASKAKIGERYITKAGFPVTVVAVDQKQWGKPAIIVSIDGGGSRVSLAHDQILWHRGHKEVSKEAIEMSTITKAAKKSSGTGMRGGERGASKTKDGILLHRKIGIVEHQVLYHEGVFTYRAKDYMSLRDVVKAVTGKPFSGTGKSFFGLRTNGNIELGREVAKGVKAAKEAVKAQLKAASKPTKAKKAKGSSNGDDEDEGSESKPRSVADVVAKVMGKSR